MTYTRNADESAELKMALKRDPVTPALRDAADSPEGDEAYAECLEGRDAAYPGSYVAELLRVAGQRLPVPVQHKP